MLFPSNIFLFCFLPVMLVLYFGICQLLVPEKYKILSKNIVLFAGSIIFYAYGEPVFVLLLLFSIFINWLMGFLIGKAQKKERSGKLLLILDIVINVGVFFVFKYLDFVSGNLNRAFSINIPYTGLKLPIGISFFTFQALSYVVDVYRKKADPENNPFYVGLYIALFPQLIAGPIVRYETVAKAIRDRKENIEKFTKGTIRFIEGLGKKVLLADSMAIIADRIFNAYPQGQGLSVLMAWFGAITYTLEIYYDFSGYSDMAIGLGKMFGFEFEENFNYPYISKSITEFWRRWHISLTTWFRDYLYFPMGGSRVSTGRMYFNLFFIWFLTGLWHGAGWTYVAWGLFSFVLQVIEKWIGLGKKWNMPAALGHFYTMFLITISMVIFRSVSMTQACGYIKSMFGIGGNGLTDSHTLFLIRDNWIMLVAAIAFSMPLSKLLKKKRFIYDILLSGLLILCIIYILKGGYSPFIYFSF